MLCGVCDIGSNTVKFGVYDCSSKNEVPRVIYFESETMKLISHIKNGILEENALYRLAELCDGYKKSAFEYGVVSFDIFATQCIRLAKNKKEICDKIYNTTGISVDILSGSAEAELSRLAMQKELPDIKKGVCVDMGGGSTEIVKFNENDIVDAVSLPFGCVVLKNKFAKDTFPDKTEIDATMKYVKEIIANMSFAGYNDSLCMIGGTAKAVEKLFISEFNECLSSDNLHRLLDFLCTQRGRELICALVPERTQTVISGLCGFIAICDKIKPHSVSVVKSGTREGYLIKKYM